MELKEQVHRFLTTDLTEQETDEMMENLVTHELDADLRKKWQNILENEYKVSRDQKPQRGHIRFLTYTLAAAASIALLLTIFFISKDSEDPQSLAMVYVNDQEIIHPGTSKGTVQADQNRIAAIGAFNAGDYAEAAGYFGRIASPTVEDLYFLGISNLKQQRYDEAVTALEKSRAESVQFAREINWFLALAHILNAQDDKAIRPLRAISAEEWKYDQAQELLQAIDR